MTHTVISIQLWNRKTTFQQKCIPLRTLIGYEETSLLYSLKIDFLFTLHNCNISRTSAPLVKVNSTYMKHKV